MDNPTKSGDKGEEVALGVLPDAAIGGDTWGFELWTEEVEKSRTDDMTAGTGNPR